MSVYVDPAVWPFRTMIMCHMWADDLAELYAMVDRIGVQRKWLQRPPGLGLPGMDASWVHFDIASTKRVLAVRHGAIETDKFGPLYWMAMRDGDIERMNMIEGMRRPRVNIWDLI